VLIRFTQSARKHRIGTTRVRHVLTHTTVAFTIPGGDGQAERTVWLGAGQAERTVWLGAGHPLRGRRGDELMTDLTVGPDYNSDHEILTDTEGRSITADYLEQLGGEAKTGYDLTHVRQLDPGDLAAMRTRGVAEALAVVGSRAKAIGEAVTGTAKEIADSALDFGAAGIGSLGDQLQRVADTRRDHPAKADTAPPQSALEGTEPDESGRHRSQR